MLALSTALAGCSLLPDEPEEEDLLGQIQLPQISKRPEYEVTTKTLETKATGSGKLMAVQEKAHYFTLEGKRLKNLYVSTGDVVEAGQTIAELDVDDMRKTLRTQQLAFKKQELEMKKLLRQKDEMDPIDFETQMLGFEQQRQDLADMQEEIAKATLVAEFSGTIVSVPVQEGAQIKAYDTIAIVADPSKLVAAAKLSKDDLEKVALGMEVQVNINTIGNVAGKVKQLPVATESNGGQGNQPERLDQYLLVEIAELPKEAVRGTPLSIGVILNRKKDAVVIPISALRTIGARTYVQVAESDGSKREVDVEIGQTTSTDVEILQGLKPGQKVVGR